MDVAAHVDGPVNIILDVPKPPAAAAPAPQKAAKGRPTQRAAKNPPVKDATEAKD